MIVNPDLLKPKCLHCNRILENNEWIQFGLYCVECSQKTGKLKNMQKPVGKNSEEYTLERIMEKVEKRNKNNSNIYLDVRLDEYIWLIKTVEELQN